MLGKLANKFGRQTLQDRNASPSADGEFSPPSPARRSVRLTEKAERAAGASGPSGSVSTSPPTTRSRAQQMMANISQKERNKIATIAKARTKSTAPSLFDSGTESEDDELEMLDSMSNASMRSLSHGTQHVLDEDATGSPPTLTSSPPLISEFDTSSWDSCGCESGIVLRDSAERDDASRNLDLLEAAVGGGELVIEPTNAITIRRTSSAADQPADGGTETAGTTPVQTKDAFPAHFRTMAALPLPIDFSAFRNSELLNDDVPTPIGSQSAGGTLLMETDLLAKSRADQRPQQLPMGEDNIHQSGAFKRVPRRNQHRNSTVSPPTLNAVGPGEKRRWGDHIPIGGGEMTTESQSSAPIAARTRGSLMLNMTNAAGGMGGGTAEFPRPVLTAARRRAVVRVLYSAANQPPAAGHHGCRGQQQLASGSTKRGRHFSKNDGSSRNSPPRPSLNFDKMRKRMLKPTENGGSDHDESG